MARSHSHSNNSPPLFRLLIPLVALMALLSGAYLVQTRTELTGERLQSSIEAMNRSTTVEELLQSGYATMDKHGTAAIESFFVDVKACKQSVLRLIEQDGDNPVIRVFMFDPYEPGLRFVDDSLFFSDPGQIREWRYDVRASQWIDRDVRFSRIFDKQTDGGITTIALTNIPESMYAPHYFVGWEGTDDTLQYPAA